MRTGKFILLIGAMLTLSVAQEVVPITEIDSNRMADSRIPAKNPESENPVNPLEPFLAGALGFMPFASGLFLSDEPAKGIVFSAIDILLMLGVYTNENSSNGDPDNTPVYYMFIGVNNVADAFFSARHAMRQRTPKTRAVILPSPQGGVQYTVNVNF